MSAASVARRGQRLAESRMTDTVRFTRPGTGAPTWNGTKYVQTVIEVYSGPCRIRWANPAPQEADAGETMWAVDRTPTVSLPISSPKSADVSDGHVGTITAVGPGSATKLGMAFVVMTGHWQTDATAHRIPVQVVSRDAG